jgi:hypothetical protein
MCLPAQPELNEMTFTYGKQAYNHSPRMTEEDQKMIVGVGTGLANLFITSHSVASLPL